jgi:putative Mg2+ transporter-C (MgtC) family protein
MFPLLSHRLALSFSGDQTRIAAQVIPGIGFIGAGAILKEKGSVSGLTSAATIFVTSGIGMAAGGGFFQTAAFATGLVMFSLILLGAIEQRFDLKQVVMGYDVVATGCETPDALIGELNRILDEEGMTMRTVRFSQTNGTSCHVQFSSEGYRSQHRVLSTKLKLSPRTATVASVLESERD